MKNICVEENVCTFDMSKSELFIANAIRRALLSDVESIAPSEVHIETNTTCQTDEYIAHRIGLIPFRYDGVWNEEEDDLTKQEVVFDVQDSILHTKHLQGSFVSTYECVVMKMRPGQRLKGRIRFVRGSGQRHARFCPVCAVGYDLEGDTIKFRFESMNGDSPLQHLRSALKRLQSRLDNVRYHMEMVGVC